MSTRRIAKVAQAIRQVVSSAILFELRDPRVTGVTVLRVEVFPDLRSAKVYISILGTEKESKLALHGLNSARGWLQGQIANELDLRYTPVLTFLVDDGVKKSIAIAQMLRDANPIADNPDPADTDSLDEVEDVADSSEGETFQDLPSEPDVGESDTALPPSAASVLDST